MFDTQLIPGNSGSHFQCPSIAEFFFYKKETIMRTCSLEQHVRHSDDQKELFEHVLKFEVSLLIQSALTATQGLEQCVLDDQQIPSIAEPQSKCSLRNRHFHYIYYNLSCPASPTQNLGVQYTLDLSRIENVGSSENKQLQKQCSIFLRKYKVKQVGSHGQKLKTYSIHWPENKQQ